MGVLQGKVTIVTGGTSGIGARTARLFATEGAQVVIAGRRTEEGAKLAAELGVDFVRTDVSVEREVAALVEGTAERYGRLDVLVNNAGASAGGEPLADLDLGVLEDLYAVHVRGVAAGLKYAARVMVPQGSGSIVNVASIGGVRAGWTGAGYSAAKAAALALTRHAAIEFGEHGIRVNAVSPGPIPTGIFGKAAGVDPAVADDTAAALEAGFRTNLRDHQAIRRVGTTGDVAQAVLWFASDASSFVTGQDLAVDGGILAGRPIEVSARGWAAVREALATAGH